MNQYPAWKYMLILGVVLIGGLYALPNYYGNDKAIQVSQTQEEAIDPGLIDAIRDQLKEADIEIKEQIDQNEVGNQILLRLIDPTTQAQALEVVETTLDDDRYTAAMNLAPAQPAWLSGLGGKPMVQGLDLQGGVHFLMEVDLNKVISGAREGYRNDVRTTLRENSIRGASVSSDENEIRIDFTSEADREVISNAVTDTITGLTVIERESGGKFILDLRVNSTKLDEIASLALQQNIASFRNRVNELGVAEPVIQQQGSNRIVVQLPGIQDTTKAKRVLGRTASLEYRAVCEGENAEEAQNTGRVPTGCRLYTFEDGRPILLSKSVIVSGSHLIDANSSFDSQGGAPVVNVTLNAIGGQRMSRFTIDNVGKRMAVVYKEDKQISMMIDGEEMVSYRTHTKVISAPNIQESFGARFRTTGLGSVTEANELALSIRSGSLAAPARIIEERLVGPSLGQENIEKGFKAVMVGFIMVLIFMLARYKLFGMIANMALFFNLIMIVALLSMLGATLTLPGIAGIVLTVGMAVDANVLIFERIREEVRNGNTPQASIRAGYQKALSTIADANVTTLIAAVVLLSLGTGPIKGFAVTLALGILTSMFTAIMGTRAVVNLIYGRRKHIEKLAI